MALLIDTCNDIDKYEESVVAGLNARKTMFAAIALLIGTVITFLFMGLFHWPTVLCVYGATPFSGFIIVMGFYEKDGMSFLQMMKYKFRKNQYKPVSFSSTETAADYEIKINQTTSNAESSEDEFERIKKMIIRGAIIAVSALILVIVLLIVLL